MKTYVSTYLHFCFRGGTDKHRNTRKLFHHPVKSFVTFGIEKMVQLVISKEHHDSKSILTATLMLSLIKKLP